MKVFVLYRSAGHDGETENLGVYTEDRITEACNSVKEWNDFQEFELNAPPRKDY